MQEATSERIDRGVPILDRPEVKEQVERVRGLVLEAFHHSAVKPGSREFFETFASQPEAFGAELCERFSREFGDEHWRNLITSHAKAWLQLAAASGPGTDLYRGRLHEISVPTLFIHGRLDPRTEPGELDAIRRELPRAEMQILESAAHSPHSESAAAEVVIELAKEFLTRHLTEEERT